MVSSAYIIAQPCTHVVPKSIPITGPYSDRASSATTPPAKEPAGAKEETKAKMATKAKRMLIKDHWRTEALREEPRDGCAMIGGGSGRQGGEKG